MSFKRLAAEKRCSERVGDFVRRQQRGNGSTGKIEGTSGLALKYTLSNSPVPYCATPNRQADVHLPLCRSSVMSHRLHCERNDLSVGSMICGGAHCSMDTTATAEFSCSNQPHRQRDSCCAAGEKRLSASVSHCCTPFTFEVPVSHTVGKELGTGSLT